MWALLRLQGQTLKFDNGKDVHIQTYALNEKTMETLRVYATYRNVDCIIGQNVVNTFKLAHIDVSCEHEDAAITAVDVMRAFGSHQWTQAQTFVQDKHPKTHGIIWDFCERYKAWRESKALQETCERCMLLWNVLRIPSFYYTRVQRGFPVFLLQWKKLTMAGMARMLALTASHTQFNEWYLLYFVKCFMYRKNVSKRTTTIMYSKVFVSKRESIQKKAQDEWESLHAGVCAWINFAKLMHTPAYSLTSMRSRGNDVRYSYIDQDAMQWNSKTFQTHWENWATPKYPWFDQMAHKTLQLLSKSLFYYLYDQFCIHAHDLSCRHGKTIYVSRVNKDSINCA